MVGEPQTWLEKMQSGVVLELKPWERLELLEYLARSTTDDGEIARTLLEGPIPTWRLDEIFDVAVTAGNEQVGLACLAAGATPRRLPEAAARGLSELCRALADAGVRVNRVYQGGLAPIHHAVLSSRPEATARTLVEACCDLTVRTPDRHLAWELGPPATHWLQDEVGRHGPTWFREAQQESIDHYVFVSEDSMFGFNPNDVQTPLWTGDEVEGFGWPNTPAQARRYLEDNGRVRLAADWFLEWLDRLEAGEDFSLSDLPAEAGVPRRRLSWR